MQRQLDGGLILRSLSEGHESDLKIGDFFNEVFTSEYGEDESHLKYWVRQLMSDEHPTMSYDDIWVVVDPAKEDTIVSALLLIPQTWRYENIEMGVGRVELVATHKDYRNRGLVRELMNTLHERSESLGHIMQSITGIPYYYRRFGYAMAVDLGGRSGINLSAVPKLKDDEQAKFTLRPATYDDVDQLIAWDARNARNHILTTIRTPELWRYELDRWDDGNPSYTISTQIIVDKDGQGVGYVMLRPYMKEARIDLFDYVLGPETSFLVTFNDVMRGISAYIDDFYKDNADNKPTRISVAESVAEPFDQIVKYMSSGVVRESIYAWYLRVPDLARFIQHIKPVLEQRLVGSVAHRYTGEAKISFFDQTGLTIKFEDGCITEVTQGKMQWDKANAGFAYHSFLNVLFGHRTVDELQHILPDNFASRDMKVLFSALFPKRRTGLNPIA